ncbi:MAG TPA: phenylalanine--tRNA ligase subunit beta [Kiritimatiellia bacterium]|nr:phenylalanine--tRNA ligase subunit beta [Kiritimatiellia bacterium]HRZ11544.1 phenylalanine--tRNA ligase subunit beta [Kiritimatiellia bacterium]HSA16905.1 phenylalanine--tRNA ligase subunit beta [Kiritimatiellia bacterium]
MRLPISWLKEYVEFEDTPRGLADKLTFSGTEVEGLEIFGSTYEGVVVGEILRVDRHPNADKLTLCAVNTGRGELTVVCGAPNARAGMKCPFAPAGVTLPNGLKLKAARIRGVESHGMLCAEDELGLSDNHAGLMELDAAWAPGTPLAEVLGPPEAVLDLSVTPNRPDCLSVLGMAREVAALYGSRAKWPEVRFAESDPAVEQLARVEVEDAEGCPRYTARVMAGVKIGPSPAWMKRRLELSGIRAISNVVDITNYVMLECGQPLHAFDQELLEEGRIVVRRVRAGEKLATLDGIERAVTPDMLAICDARRPVAMAGIMGGAGSEIRDATHTVLLESACFRPQDIRRTSKKLGLSTESSYRFERGVDIGRTEWASRRAAQLMADLAGATVARGVVDVFAKQPEPRRILCRFDKVNALLGLNESGERIKQVFESLELPVEKADAQGCTVRVPSFRPDLEVEVDLAEEFARVHGLDNIPSPSPHAQIIEGSSDAAWRAVSSCRAHLVGLGLREIMNYSFVSARFLDLFDPGDATRRLVIPNPVSQDHAVMRTALAPQMVDTLGRNLARQVEEAAFFEIGRVFGAGPDGQPFEEDRLAIGLMGPAGRTGLDRRRPVEPQEMYLWLKGAWEELARAQGVEWRLEADAGCPYLEPGSAAALFIGGEPVGRMGLVAAKQRAEWRMTQPVAVLEVRLAPLLGRAHVTPACRPVPAYPSVRRDVALIVDAAIRHEDVVRLIRKAAPAELENIEIFDIFSGGSIGAGRRSLAYALTYRSASRTLTDEEANGYHEAIKQALKRELNAEIRES